MASELASVVLLLWLNWQICSHSSEKYLWIKILKPWRPRNMEVFNENLTVQAIIFQKILSCVSLYHKDFKKHLLIKVSNFSEYFFRQLRHHHMVRSKTGILLEIILDVCKYLIVSLVLTKFLLWQQHHFCLFQLVPCLSVNLPWCAECIFYSVPRKKRYNLLPEGTDIYIQPHNHRKDLSPCLSLYYYGKVIV